MFYKILIPLFSFQLRVHHCSHTSSRPFNCTKCNNYFSHPEDLKRHESHLCPTALPPFALQLSTPTACGLLAVGDLGLAWRGKQSRWTWGVGRDEFRLNNRLGTGRFFSEMQKVSDAADISVLFFQMVLVFEKATCKTMQTLVPAAPVLHSSSANNASTISNSAVNISAISTRLCITCPLCIYP